MTSLALTCLWGAHKTPYVLGRPLPLWLPSKRTRDKLQLLSSLQDFRANHCLLLALTNHCFHLTSFHAASLLLRPLRSRRLELYRARACARFAMSPYNVMSPGLDGRRDHVPRLIWVTRRGRVDLVPRLRWRHSQTYPPVRREDGRVDAWM